MNIIVYTKTNCGWCDELVGFLNKNKMTFEERNTSENSEFFKEMVDKSGQTLAPTVDMDGKILADTDAYEMAEYLKNK